MRPMRFVAALLLCVACESGTSMSVQVDFGPDVTAQFSLEQPGIVRVDTPSIDAFNVTALCGNELGAIKMSHDFGLGCLEDALENNDEEVVGWIEPLPVEQGYDAAAVCDSALDESPHLIDVVTPEGAPPLPFEPDETDLQGTGTVTWRRDLSPCGGRGDAAVTISALIGG